ncbi:uncharacterized protein [Littorina saxatilis]|uniref:uncharacterized protein n=1 Tax=Littorina saxatilis TaxID=31220 RepID=UPI0038B581B4
MTTVRTPVQRLPTDVTDRQREATCTSTAAWRLKIESRQELREFLRAIQPEFLRVVDPRESGLLDILCAADLLTETDNESMSGKDVNIRKDQARKLWIRLNKMAVGDFLAEVGPAMLKVFPHIIPEMYLTQEVEGGRDRKGVPKGCLRHDIMSRIRAPTMADMLYHHGCFSFEDYEDIVSEEYDDEIVWGKMLDSITGHSDDLTKQIVEALQALLERYKVQVHCCPAELVSRCVSCTCTRGKLLLPASPALPLRKVGSWVKKSPFQQSPRSSGSSVTRVDLRSYSGGTSLGQNDSQSLSSDSNLPLNRIPKCPDPRGFQSDRNAKADDTRLQRPAHAEAFPWGTEKAMSVKIEKPETPLRSANNNGVNGNINGGLNGGAISVISQGQERALCQNIDIPCPSITISGFGSAVACMIHSHKMFICLSIVFVVMLTVTTAIFHDGVTSWLSGNSHAVDYLTIVHNATISLDKRMKALENHTHYCGC